MRIRVEHRDEALGIGVARPRLSWQLTAPATGQSAYELERDDVGSLGWVQSADTTLRPWPGPPLAPREQRCVRVRVRTDVGVSPWSAWAPVESGLLDAPDWAAPWISPDDPADPHDLTPGSRPAYLLRGEFTVTSAVVSARLRVSALGLAETFLDGNRVGHDELTPGYTDYARRVQILTLDVTHQLTPGRHELSALLADGWYRGSVGVGRAVDQWGERTAYLAQLEMTQASGEVVVVGTGPHWQWSLSPVTVADLITGQHEDHRIEPGPWRPVLLRDDIGYAGLTPSPAPPVRRVREIRPRSVTEPVPGRQIFDLGENINGWVRLTDLGPADTHLILTHGESLGPDGDVTTEHLRPDMPFLPEPLPAGQVDEVISSGRAGSVFEPRLTTHGFRYVRVEGHPRRLGVGDLTGVVVHTDLAERGSFACSDADLNALHAAAIRSFLGNACDVPTDCPTRERAAWTGDWALFAPVATFTHDVAGFSTKWLRDLAGAQWDNGILDNQAPMPRAEKTGFLAGLNGSAGWCDAIVDVPWELWQEYGDLDGLGEFYPHMVRWVEHGERSARDERHPDRSAARAEPAPYEKWLWDSGFHWGEWLEPGGEPKDFPAFVGADKSDVATAYLARSARRLAQIATLLGRDEERVRWDELADWATWAWQCEFIDPQGRLLVDTQATHVRALAFDLVLPEHRQLVADRLAELVRDNGDRLSTGFLATALLLPTLADHGHLDTAYRLLLRRDLPSWLCMLDRGATTMWERWDGISDDGPRGSLNHYAKGAVIGFLHGWVAGLQRVDPTWRRFRVAPRPGGGITHASARHESPHGWITVNWRQAGGSFELDVTVPPSTRAEIELPDGTRQVARPGRHHWSADA